MAALPSETRYVDEILMGEILNRMNMEMSDERCFFGFGLDQIRRA